ncbi:MAG: hypothetical protein CMN71_13775 [Sphingomonadaceae bacterium]|nr:hypothetical protein [Sphingomonadaceae bacterium]
MNIFTTGGHDARRAHAYALHIQLGLPIGERMPSSVKFASVTGVDGPIVEVAASKMARDGQDCVIAVYPDEHAATPDWYILLLRQPGGVMATRVFPAATGPDEPLVLVAEDRQRQFGIGEADAIEQVSITAVARRRRSQRRAAERIAASARALGPLCTGGPGPGDVFLDSRGNIVTMASLAA